VVSGATAVRELILDGTLAAAFKAPARSRMMILGLSGGCSTPATVAVRGVELADQG